jgi:hypothetical protein
MRFEMPASWLAGHSLKSRLYLIITFLGLLPILGVVLAFATFEDARRDHVALDHAARGTIYLEHINGLVYSVVMESRGIIHRPIAPSHSRAPSRMREAIAFDTSDSVIQNSCALRFRNPCATDVVRGPQYP